MADTDRMINSELALLADEPPLWDWDDPWDTPIDPTFSLDLFPCQIEQDPQPPQTVRPSDVSFHPPPIHIPSLFATPSPAEITPSDIDSSDDYDLFYPSDQDYLPSSSPVSALTPITPVSPVSPSINPASLIAPNPYSRDSSPSSTRPSRRPSRTMTTVPVPIPNLTKKSRGRKVPTSSNGEPVFAASRDKTKKGVRTYTCHADGCGKCFVRGEHLKRHIRSIHTEEKRASH